MRAKHYAGIGGPQGPERRPRRFNSSRWNLGGARSCARHPRQNQLEGADVIAEFRRVITGGKVAVLEEFLDLARRTPAIGESSKEPV